MIGSITKNETMFVLFEILGFGQNQAAVWYLMVTVRLVIRLYYILGGDFLLLFSCYLYDWEFL